MTNENTFHFCQVNPPKETYTDVQQANQLTNQQYEDLINRMYAFMHNPEFGSELRSNIQQYCMDNNLDMSSIKDMLKTLLVISRDASNSKLTPGQLYSDMQRLGMNASRASLFCQAWKKNLTSKTEARNSNAETTKRLMDMEWKFGVTASSSELHRVGSCYLQLKMVIIKELKTENILMELSLPQFYKFMHEMENAKLSLETAS